jgi:hypothetical protein
MIPQPNIAPTAKTTPSCALSMGLFAFGANFVRDCSCLAAADTVDFQQRDDFGSPASLVGAQPSLVALTHRKDWVTRTRAQDPKPATTDHARGLENQLLHHRLDSTALGFVAHQRIGLGGRMPPPGVQGQFQAVAQATRGHRKRAIAIRARVIAAHQFIYLCTSVVQGKGSQINRCVATSRGTEVYGLPVDTAAQQLLVHLGCRIEPEGCMRVHELAQGRARRFVAKHQRRFEEGVISKVLDGIKIAFTHAQQGEVGFENLVVGEARAHGHLQIYQRINVDTLEVLADKSQFCRRAEVVGEFFDSQAGHVRAHLLGEQYITTKLLTSIGRSAYFDCKVMDAGVCKPIFMRFPQATIPWQHVLEPLSGYLALAQKLCEQGFSFADAWNFGPEEADAKPVQWIVEKLCSQISNTSWQSDALIQPHEANMLKLDSSKAKPLHAWRLLWNLRTAFQLTLAWHHAWKDNADMADISIEQIQQYEAA